MGCLLTKTSYSKRFIFSIFTLSWHRLKESKKIWHSEMPLSAFYASLPPRSPTTCKQLLKSIRWSMQGSSFCMDCAASCVSSTGTGASELLSLFLPVTAFTTPFTALRLTLGTCIALVSNGTTGTKGESLRHGSQETTALIYHPHSQHQHIQGCEYCG